MLKNIFRRVANPQRPLPPPPPPRRTQVVPSPTFLKFLLLGAGETGKATFAKQLRSLYGNCIQFKAKDDEPLVRGNVVKSFQVLCNVENLKRWASVPLQHKAAAARIRVTRTDPPIHMVTEQLVNDISLLWQEQAIQEVYNHRSEYQLSPSTEYFARRFTQLGTDEFIFSFEDFLHLNVSTTGMVEYHDCIFADQPLLFFLTGGQRSERKKWIFEFEDVSMVFFFANPASYDQVLYEGPGVNDNRLTEDLDLFEDIVGCEWFLQRETHMVLVLSMTDIFDEKILGSQMSNSAECADLVARVAAVLPADLSELVVSYTFWSRPAMHLSDLFPDYTGPRYDSETSLDWIEAQFGLCAAHHRASISIHCVCDLDSDQVDSAFQQAACQHHACPCARTSRTSDPSEQKGWRLVQCVYETLFHDLCCRRGCRCDPAHMRGSAGQQVHRPEIAGRATRAE